MEVLNPNVTILTTAEQLQSNAVSPDQSAPSKSPINSLEPVTSEAPVTFKPVSQHSESASHLSESIHSEPLLTADNNAVHDEDNTKMNSAAVEESPTIDVVINNVVCTFSTRCHLNLREIARTASNVEYKKAQGMLNMKLRKPSATASIWSSGKVTVTGASSEENSHIAARRIARIFQNLGYKVKFANFRIVNVLGTCSLPFGILINEFSRANPLKVQYEPELHPGATYTLKEPRATLKVFSTGSVTVTAPRVENVQLAIEHIFPLVYEHKTVKRPSQVELRYMKKMLEMEEFLDEDDNMILEPGEIPTTKTQRKNTIQETQSQYGTFDYGSSSEGDDVIDSDDSIE